MITESIHYNPNTAKISWEQVPVEQVSYNLSYPIAFSGTHNVILNSYSLLQNTEINGFTKSVIFFRTALLSLANISRTVGLVGILLNILVPESSIIYIVRISEVSCSSVVKSCALTYSLFLLYFQHIIVCYKLLSGNNMLPF